MPVLTVQTDGDVEPGQNRSKCYSMPVPNSRLGKIME